MSVNGYVPFLVANKRTALDLSITDSWIEPQDAFVQLFDGYNYRGVTYKRDGYTFFDAFPSAIDGGAGHHYQNISNVTTTANAQVTTTAAHGLSNGQLVRLTGVTGITGGPAPLNGTRWIATVVDPTNFTINNSTPFAGAYNANTGTVSIFAGNPITMISSWINPSNNNAILIVCDTKRAAYFDTTNMCLAPIGYTNQFTKTGNFKFWFENYDGYLFITNNFDPIFYYNGTQNATGLTSFSPALSAVGGDVVNFCLMIKAVGNRLVLFNTNETGANTQTSTRVRWSEADVDPVLTANAWYEGISGKGGAEDLLGTNYIITLGQIQDNVIVTSQIFSQSQPYAAYFLMGVSSDPQNPFTFLKISTSRPVDSTFGTINLDRYLTEVGKTDLTTTDGNTVTRYDDRIPDFAITEMEQSLVNNCFGIRNDSLWQTWLLYTPTGQSKNTRALVFNYQDRSWAIFRWDQANANLGFNVLGLFANPFPDPTWSSLPIEWASMGEATWTNLSQNQELSLVGGDYTGNLWSMFSGAADAINGESFSGLASNGNAITMDWVTRQWFPFAKEGSAAQLGYVDLLIKGDAETVVTMNFSIEGYPPYQSPSFTGVNFLNAQYGPISGATNANPCVITAISNPLVNGSTIFIYGVQGMVGINGIPFTITTIDANHFSIPINTSNTTLFPPYTSGGIYTTKVANFNTFWSRIWSGQTGTFHQFEFVNQGIDESFELHAMIFWFKKSGRLFQGG